MNDVDPVDVVVVGGGPAGAAAATDLAREGRSVVLLDRAGRIKPCGGAIPPRLIRDFGIPESQIVARIDKARIVSPTDRHADMPIANGYVGMVDREHFDEWLRCRASAAGAERRLGKYVGFSRDPDGTAVVHYEVGQERRVEQLRARCVIGADGARSKVARDCLPNAKSVPCVFAYHEIVESPVSAAVDFDAVRCDVLYNGELSPDFYAWVFPHGATSSVGVGSACKGFSLRGAVAQLRGRTGLDRCETLRCEGAPIPLKPLRRWDNGVDVVVVGDAAGAVAPASGEGIYYAMTSGRFAAEGVDRFLSTGDPRDLASVRKRFMKANGTVFWILGIMQKYWYSSNSRRERFVSICEDPDVQYLTWQAYTEKKLVRAKPLAHARVFIKDMAHLCGLVAP